jgi:isoleucyl-tRNA synthetase
MENNVFVILETAISDELMLEGLARELVSKVQQMRKAADFNVTDRIAIAYAGDADVDRAVEAFRGYISRETLADSITSGADGDKVDLNGHKTALKVTRI